MFCFFSLFPTSPQIQRAHFQASHNEHKYSYTRLHICGTYTWLCIYHFTLILPLNVCCLWLFRFNKTLCLMIQLLLAMIIIICDVESTNMFQPFVPCMVIHAENVVIWSTKVNHTHLSHSCYTASVLGLLSADWPHVVTCPMLHVWGCGGLVKT